MKKDGAARPSVIPGGWTPRLVLSFASIVGVQELIAANYQMTSTARSEISAHYATHQSAWLLTAFLLVGAVVSPIAGKLADMYGKRRVLLLAVAGATLGGLVTALAPNFGVVIAGRALQGLLVPCTFLGYSLMRDVYPSRILPMAVSLMTAGMGLINIPAPWITGWLMGNWGFHGVFWFFAIVPAVLLAPLALATDESPVRNRSRLDVLGALLLGAGLACLLIGVSFGPEWGWGSASTLGALAGGVVLIGLWVVSALRSRNPLIDVRFFKRRPMILTALTAGLASANTGVFNALLPTMCMTPLALGLGYGFGVDAKGYALFQVPVAAGAVVGGYLVGRAMRWTAPRNLMITGHALLVLGTGLTALWHDAQGPLMVWALIEGLGLGFSYAAAPNLVIAVVPPQLQASMSSMVQVFQSTLAAILPAVAFAVLNGHIAVAEGGYDFYSDGGMRIVFLIACGASVVAFFLALGLPKQGVGGGSAGRGARAGVDPGVTPVS